MEIVIITGMSGAGKTEALKCLEDIGYFAIDNLPASLLVKIVDIGPAGGKKFKRVALVTDVRAGKSFDDLFLALEELEAKDVPYTIMFLDASDETLVRRFSETRRIHPLESENLRVVDTISEERKVLDPLRERADLIVDTSHLNIYQLRDKLEEVAGQDAAPSAKLTLVSFGFKHGHPRDADIIVDVRFLPNPYWAEELRDLDGSDPSVRGYVLDQGEVEEFLEKFVDLLELVLPGYRRERRAYLTIGVGCTGGRHRSVVIADELARRFMENGNQVSVLHRDIGKR
ncbi:MAG: RNase adapter RapZ [Actinomycetia bacterium]|nr:RNase adapter RapZ [Actinomycetes bacterium]